MPRRYFLIALIFVLLWTPLSYAQDAQPPTIRVEAGFSSQSTTVHAKGEHNMADSGTLRELGCEGYVAASPAVIVSYDAKERRNSLTIRASGADDLALLIGTASNDWHCAASTKEGGRPEIELPAGSGDFSIWVGTHSKGAKASAATLTIAESSAPVETACGSANATIPSSIRAEDWKEYRCISEEDAGAVWDACQPRSNYTEHSAEGCPGAQRCCPPSSDSATSAALRAQSADADTNSSTSPSSATAADDEDDPFASYARAPIGSVAEGAPNQLTFETTPFGKTSAPLLIHWRGFPEAELPVRATTTEDGEVLFTLLGKDFPQEVTDSLLIIKKPRTLRAKRAVTLSSKAGEIRIKSGSSIELLAQTRRNECALRFDGKIQRAACPAFADFDDTSGVFHGLSPLHYTWWIAVEDEDQQRGWLHIDRERPEFAIELKDSP